MRSLPTEPRTMNVFLVEDDDVLREALRFVLEQNQYAVTPVASAAALYRQMAVQNVDAVILDVGLEGENGFTICEYLRAHNPHLGIVFVTGMTAPDDRFKGLSCGADAYLTKPVDTRELLLILARIQNRWLARAAELTRLSGARAPELPSAATPSTTASPSPTPWTLRIASGLLQAPNGQTRRVSSNERALLYGLGQAGGEPLSAEALAKLLDFEVDDGHRHRIEVIVSRLRRNVEQSTGMHLPLMSVRGTGYCVRDLSLLD
ncbi:MAG: response regulator transcription factor [Ideonella sp.]|nr:response regulator transcription factor [Ideonella sp.]